MFSLFRRAYNDIDYSDLISKLEIGNHHEVHQLLFQQKHIKYLPITYDMLNKLKKPNNLSNGLTVHELHQKGRYELVIFRKLWIADDFALSPLIMNRKDKAIVGIMLPFNELLAMLSAKDQKQIHELSMIWTGIVMKNKFGI